MFFNRSSRALAAAVVLLAAIAAIDSVWPIWRAFFQLAMTNDEGWNIFHVDEVLQGRPLYPPPGSLITSNYPPLSFYFIAALSRMTSLDAVYVGRALSLIAVGVAALAVSSIVRHFGASRLAAAVAALWLVATMTHFYSGDVGMTEPHVFALAIMAGALAWMLRRQRLGRAAEPAILLMVVAGFYKHSLIATPIAALIWLAAGNRWLGLRAALVGAAFAAAGLLTCIALFGAHFWRELLFYPREMSIAWGFANLGRLQFILPAMVVWATWAWPNRAERSAQFSATYIATAFCTYFLITTGRPSGMNAQFELAIATAIGLGLTFHGAMAHPLARRFGAEAVRLLILGVIIGRLLLSNHVEPYLVVASADYRAQFAAHAEVTRQEVARVRAISEPVYCSVWLVCRWAGKPFIFDDAAIDIAIARGRMTRAELEARLIAENIRLVTVDPRVGARSLERRIFSAVR